MKRPQYVFRPNLSDPQHRRAWALLQQVPSVTGKYPQLNKKLERTGKYSNLARKNNEYTDYIYKNQYSAVAESRKLDGSKAWEGYYLS